MSTIPSAEFRKTYAKLAEPTVVTVNGHPIGVWTPTPGNDESLVPVEDPPQSLIPIAVREQVAQALDPRFNTRPFTPVPKSRK
jgi:hypothetical protein